MTLGAESPELDGALGLLASRWRASGIVSIRDDNPIDVITGQDNAFTGIRNQRPNQVSDEAVRRPADAGAQRSVGRKEDYEARGCWELGFGSCNLLTSLG